MEKTGADGQRLLLDGLDEFREHLGGKLTVLMLRDIGCGEDVHELDLEIISRCIDELRDIHTGHVA
jgi:3-dehydroquinate synthase